jgi:RNA-directed DNA polymerase
MGTGDASPVTDTGYPRRTGMGHHRDGARVVVRGRESRPHGEGEQGIDRRARPQERSVDSDHQADKAWLLSVQRKLYQWSRQS